MATPAAGPPVPPPGHPFSPFTVNGSGARDTLAWQLWWDMNRERFLDLRGRVAAARAATGEDGFHLGAGQRSDRASGLRPTPEQIERTALPALVAALAERADVDQRCAELLALARACDPADFGSAYAPDALLAELLTNPVAEVRQASALALGVFGREDSADALAEVLWGGAAGEEHTERGALDPATRAFATYGLALLAQRSADAELRQGAIWYLTAQLARVGEPTVDVHVAAAIGAGLVALEPGPPCECGGAQHAPNSSRQAQIHFLLRRFESPEVPDLARAHLATALARLVADGALPDHTALVGDALLAAMTDGDAPRVVREGAALALGRVGDADLDELDVAIRDELVRAARSADGLLRRFALVSLAETAARAGQGDAPWAGTPDVRGELLRLLSRGKAGVAEWSAVALGVLGHDLAAAGQRPSADVDAALRSALARSRAPERQAALALALGLRRDAAAGEALADLLEDADDPDARAFASLALGLIGEQEAREVLDLALEQAGERATREAAAIGLALLGDRTVVERLVGYARDAERDAARESAVQALGAVGDATALEVLTAILRDDDAPDALRTRAAAALGRICDLDDRAWHARLSADLHYAANPASLANARAAPPPRTEESSMGPARLRTIGLLALGACGGPLLPSAAAQRTIRLDELAPATEERVLETEEYELHVVGVTGDAEELGGVLERAYARFREELRARPRPPRGGRLELHLLPDRAAFLERIRRDGTEPPSKAAFAYYQPDEGVAYAHRLGTPWLTRYALLHAAFQQFHGLAKRKNRDLARTWIVLGMADHFALHTWDGEALELGALPRLAEIDLPGLALARLQPGGLPLDRLYEEGVTFAELNFALTRYLLDHGGPELRRKLEKLALGYSGSKVGPQAFTQALGAPGAMAARLAEWLAGHQLPLEVVGGGWEDRGAGGVVGDAGGQNLHAYALFRRSPERLSVSLAPGSLRTGYSGVVLAWTSVAEHLRVELHEGMLYVRRLDGGRVRTLDRRAVDVPEGGRLALEVERQPGRVVVRASGAELVIGDVPEARFGLWSHQRAMEFRELEWE